MTTNEERIQALPVGLKRLWTGVLLAPGAWVVAEGVGYYVAARSCELGVAGIPLVGTTHPSLTQALLSLALLIVAVAGLVIAVANWRAVGGRPTGDEPPEWGRARFMSYAGVLAGVLFTAGIVLFALPVLFVNPCSQAR